MAQSGGYVIFTRVKERPCTCDILRLAANRRLTGSVYAQITRKAQHKGYAYSNSINLPAGERWGKMNRQTKTMPPANNRLGIVPAIRKLSHVPAVYKNIVTSARIAAYCSLPLMFITVIRTKLHPTISMYPVGFDLNLCGR